MDVELKQHELLCAIREAEMCDCTKSLYELQKRIPGILNLIVSIDVSGSVKDKLEKRINERIALLEQDKKIEYMIRQRKQRDVVDTITADVAERDTKTQVFTRLQIDVINIIYEECNKEYLLS
jgi:hypothetical protein